MSDEQIQAQPTEPAAQAASSEVQQKVTPSSEPAAQTPPPTTEKPVWDGKLESLKNPEDIERGKAMTRYLTKKTQELTEKAKLAQEYEQLKTSSDWKQYEAWKQAQQFQQPSSVAPQRTPSQIVPPEAWEQMGIDPNAAALVERTIESKLAEKEQYFAQELQKLRMEQNKTLKLQEIEAFGEANPNFYKYLEDPIARPALQFLLDKEGKSLEEAYELVDDYMSKAEQDASNKALAAAQARVVEKKDAVAATPSVNSSSDWVEVENEAESRRVAFELARTGDPRKVRIRKK